MITHTVEKILNVHVVVQDNDGFLTIVSDSFMTKEAAEMHKINIEKKIEKAKK